MLAPSSLFAVGFNAPTVLPSAASSVKMATLDELKTLAKVRATTKPFSFDT